MVDKKKKVLFKIPSDEEIRKAPPAPEPAPEVVPENLPVKEPAPTAVVDTAAEAVEKEKKAKARKAGPGPKPDRKPKLTANEKRAIREERKAKRLERQRNMRINTVEGITVGGRGVVNPRTTRRLTRDRRREAMDRRRSLKVTVAGEEAEISESSKYMLDMLIKD